MNSQKEKYNVTIIGAGMVGTSLACALAKTQPNLKIALIEAFPIKSGTAEGEEKFSPSFDDRSTVLSAGSSRIYQSIGIWDALSKYSEPIKKIHVSEKNKFASTRLLAKDYGVKAFGYVTENKWMGKVLLAEVQNRKNINFYCPAKLTNVELCEDKAVLNVEKDGQDLVVESELLVVSDGADSGTCKLLGVDYETQSYEQVALIANVATEKSHEGVAYERFTATGPVAFLPLQKIETAAHRSAMILTAPEKNKTALMETEDTHIKDLIYQKFGKRLGEIISVGKRDVYPLVFRQAKEQVRRNLVIIGNAAHSLHPVAGQGFNLSLRDVSELTHVLQSQLYEGKALGEIGPLQHYVQKRQMDQAMTIALSDKLPKLFGSNDQILSFGRSLGLLGFEASPLAKKLFVKQTMGMQAVY